MVEDPTRTLKEHHIKPLHGYRPAALVALIGPVVALLVAIPHSVRAGGGGLDDTPDDRVLLVTTNLQEAYGSEDVKNLRDMKNYVDRLLTLVPYNPDILNLQEITGKGARFIKERLSKATGDDYTVAIAPKGEPWIQKGSTVIKTETAILLNNTTMKKEGPDGFLTTTYKSSDKAPGQLREKKLQAFAGATERATGITYALTSTHYSLGTVMESKTTAENYKGKWSKEINANLRDKFGADALRIVTGDFNTGRCRGVTTIAGCRFTPTWKAFHDAGYRSAVHLLTDDGAFDHIYTPSGVHRAELDGKYNGKTAGPNEFYSDHQLRWALLSSDVTPPTAPTGLQLDQVGNDHDVMVSWVASTDVGSGVAVYQIWRKGQDSDEFSMRKEIAGTELQWRDTQSLYGHRTYTYYVVAVDAAHWLSAASKTEKIDL